MAARRGRPRKLYTLTEVSKRTGISMPTLQKYKREHSDQIPSEGEGRRQRYPVAALKVFEQLKEAAVKRRGRRVGKKATKRTAKKAANGRPRRTKAAVTRRGKTRATGGELLTLAEIERRTGISYPTLLRYTRLHGNRIPHEGQGRKRRYAPQAVEVFQQLRASSRRGRRKGAATGTAQSGSQLRLSESLRRLEKAQRALQQQVASLEKRLSVPIRVTLQR